MESNYYVGWFMLAFIVAGIAQGKNRSGFGWFFGALLFGPLALICLVMFADKLSSNETKSIRDMLNR